MWKALTPIIVFGSTFISFGFLIGIVSEVGTGILLFYYKLVFDLIYILYAYRFVQHLFS